MLCGPVRIILTEDEVRGQYIYIYIWVIIKIHALFPVHILVTSNIFVPVLL